MMGGCEVFRAEVPRVDVELDDMLSAKVEPSKRLAASPTESSMACGGAVGL